MKVDRRDRDYNINSLIYEFDERGAAAYLCIPLARFRAFNVACMQMPNSKPRYSKQMLDQFAAQHIKRPDVQTEAA